MKKKKKTNSFLILYTKSCTPHLAHFNSYSTAKKFIAKFHGEYAENKDDNWIDCVIKGKLKRTYEGWDSYIEVHSKGDLDEK